MTEPMPVKIKYDGKDSFTKGVIEIQHWNKKECTTRALKFLGKCWLGALIAVPFPIVHLIVVPGLFLAGPIGAYILLQQEKIITGGTGICANCNQELKIERSKFAFPITELCTKCRKNLTIEI